MAESRNQRILIVDNDEKESNRLEAIVQEAGYDTISTWSGFEALELLKSQKIDILLGQQLPARSLYQGLSCEST